MIATNYPLSRRDLNRGQFKKYYKKICEKFFEFFTPAAYLLRSQ